MKIKYLYHVIILMSCAIVSSCNGTRQCVAPELDMPDSYSFEFDDTTSLADLEWWQFYGDTTLCGFIRTALEYNKDILMAAARVEEARLLYASTKKDLLPQLSANIYANHETNDYDGNTATTDTEIGAKLALNWEADLWKRLSWNKRKKEAVYRASFEERRAMDVLVISEVAEAYFRLLALDSELDIVRQTLVTRGEGLKMAKIRFEGGLTSEMVYRQAEVEYMSTASMIPSLEAKIAMTENSLNVLMGRYPVKEVKRNKTILNEVMAINPAQGVPSQLLTRRPDLLASEMALREAMAEVGLTYADRFPRFTIGLTGGVENDRLANLIKSPFSYIVASIAGPVFDFGKRKKKYQASLAAYEHAKLSYEKNVLVAFTEVNDARLSYISARKEALLKDSLRESALKYVRLARIQYEGGTSLYMDVLDAQRRYFDSQIALSNAVRDEYLALVRLYKSLGGGARTTTVKPALR